MTSGAILLELAMPSQHDIAARALTREILEQLANSDGGYTHPRYFGAHIWSSSPTTTPAALATLTLTRALLEQVAESGVELALAALACATAEVITASGDSNKALDTFRTYFAAALDDVD
jgi:hypothetical protein